MRASDLGPSENQAIFPLGVRERERANTQVRPCVFRIFIKIIGVNGLGYIAEGPTEKKKKKKDKEKVGAFFFYRPVILSSGRQVVAAARTNQRIHYRKRQKIVKKCD